MTDADKLYQAMIDARLAMHKPNSIIGDGKAHRYRMFSLGWLLVTIGEMSSVLSDELLVISERSQAGGVHG